MIQDTSLEAYLKLKKADTRRDQVLQTLRLLPDATNAELADKLGWPINRVTPRINELRVREPGEKAKIKLGLVLDAGRRTCRVTGSTAHAWKAKYPVLPPAFKEKPVAPKPQTQQLI
jgi:hypothetical protein